LLVRYLSVLLMAANCFIIGAVIKNRIEDLSDWMVTCMTAVIFVQVAVSTILTILILAGYTY